MKLDMKLNRLETHDRLQYFTKQNFDISECCQNLINQHPFGDHAFYIFAHSRTEENGIKKRIIWQPRLTKPKVETNSMLFKAYPGTDFIKTIWMIPCVELWKQFEPGKMTHNPTIWSSIEMYKKNRILLEIKEDDDLTDEQIDCIYRDISINSKSKRHSLEES